MESPHGDPTTPGVARMSLPVCAYLPVRMRPPASDVYPPVRIRSPAWADRKTGRTADTQSRTGGTRAAPAPPYPMQLASSAYPVCLPCPSAPTAYPRLPASHLARMCHIVNESATRASRKTAFCQALLLFLDLSKRYALIHSHLSPH